LSRIKTEDVIKKLLQREEDDLSADKNVQKNQERRRSQDLPEIFLPKKEKIEKPTNELLSKWYGHITRLIVDIYIIESTTDPCKRCERWKSHPYEKKWIYKLHDLLGLDETQVKVNIYPCDWNALQVAEYIDDLGNPREDSTEMDWKGENYFVADGTGVGYYPGVVLYLDSTKLKAKKIDNEPSKKVKKVKVRSTEISEIGDKNQTVRETNMDGYEDIVFPGIEGRIKKKLTFKIGEKVYHEEIETTDTSLIRYILRFLRTLDVKDVPIADNVSALLGQYHHHTRER